MNLGIHLEAHALTTRPMQHPYQLSHSKALHTTIYHQSVCHWPDNMHEWPPRLTAHCKIVMSIVMKSRPLSFINMVHTVMKGLVIRYYKIYINNNIPQTNNDISRSIITNSSNLKVALNVNEDSFPDFKGGVIFYKWGMICFVKREMFYPWDQLFKYIMCGQYFKIRCPWDNYFKIHELNDKLLKNPGESKYSICGVKL